MLHRGECRAGHRDEEGKEDRSPKVQSIKKLTLFHVWGSFSNCLCPLEYSHARRLFDQDCENPRSHRSLEFYSSLSYRQQSVTGHLMRNTFFYPGWVLTRYNAGKRAFHTNCSIVAPPFSYFPVNRSLNFLVLVFLRSQLSSAVLLYDCG